MPSRSRDGRNSPLLSSPSQAASQSASSPAPVTSDHSRPDEAASGTGAPAGRWIHCASNSTSNPSPARSRQAKLSFTEQPGESVSIHWRTDCAATCASRVTASGYSGGVRLVLSHTYASSSYCGDRPCAPHTASHHTALFSAARRSVVLVSSLITPMMVSQA